MAPTREEELKLRSYNGDLALLGPSECFLKVLVDIPFAFKRLEALLFIASLHEESSSIKDSFATLEVACTTLRNSRLFLKLLEAVLKTGNRMNVGTYRGGAQAFKLDTLLKLSDVKGTDGKTTLLSFVVQEMIRTEGNKAARRAKSSSSEDVLHQEALEEYRGYGLEVVSKLSEELDIVKKAALIDGETLTSTVLKLGNMLKKTKDFANNEMKTFEDGTQFQKFLTEFVGRAEAEIMWLLEEEKRVMALVKNTGDYFHGKSRKDEGLQLFVVVRDFLLLLDNVCNDIRRTTAMQAKKNQSNSTEEPFGRDKLFPSNKGSPSGYTSSDEESQESDSP
ncbi:putative formin, FH2 domain-containing protein [Helianthus anomalus]